MKVPSQRQFSLSREIIILHQPKAIKTYEKTEEAGEFFSRIINQFDSEFSFICQRMKKLQKFIILTYLIIYVADEFMALRAASIVSLKGIVGAVKESLRCQHANYV